MFVASDQVFAYVSFVKWHLTTGATRERFLHCLVLGPAKILVRIECTGIALELFPCSAVSILEVFLRRNNVFQSRPLTNRHVHAPALILMRTNGREAVGCCQIRRFELCLLWVESERVERAVEYVVSTHGQATRGWERGLRR